MTFTRKWLDVDTVYYPYKIFEEYGSNLCIFDLGIVGNNALLLGSPDGDTWSTIFSITAAAYGNSNIYDGADFALYNDSLFIALFRNVTTEQKVLEWDGTTLTSHLLNPQAGGNRNDLAEALEVFARRLWCLTDVTDSANDRRVVYFYDGTNWTAITDYDGVAYLDYNIADGSSPTEMIRHRTSRLFVANGELYMLASRWSGSEWAWEAWQLDAENMDNFTQVFDSSTFADNFALSAVIWHENKIKVLGNELLTDRNPTDIAKLYSSEDMETWIEETAFPVFEDEFDDAARDSKWDDEKNSGTITEIGDVLTLAVANGVDGDFWGATKNAPIATIDISEREVTVVAKLNSYAVNDETRAGIYITDTVSGNNGIVFSRMRNVGAGRNGLTVTNMGVGGLAYVAVTTLPIWLRVRISGSGAGSVMEFEYSTDGITWVNLWTQNNETWGKVGLVAWNWNAFNAISAPFEFFHVYESVGFPYGEAVFDGKFYLNCINTLKNNTWIRHWNGRLKRFTLDQEITTNTHQYGGGLKEFSGSLYAGKYREVYAEPAATRKQLKRKRQSLWLLELNWKNKKGETLTEHVAPLDVRADERFWAGRLKMLSSFTRAIDDRTGIFKISDLSATLANHDMRYSERLARYPTLKNQMARLWHCWADEPEAWRRHVITLTVDDYVLEGAHFELKFKDITQRYFAKKVPESICTVADFADIHPDHIGRYMPEVLGDTSMVTGEERGAVEAVYVNILGGGTRDFLAARSWLRSAIDNANFQVYKNNVPVAATMTAHTDGHSYINYDNSATPNDRITFDCYGYPFGIWDDPTNNFVQNPAYISAYFLRILMGLDATWVNMLSFDDMADYFETKGEHQDGYLILQDPSNTMELFRQLLFTFGMKGFVAMDGRLKVDIKDIHNWQLSSLDAHVFEQIQLYGALKRLANLPNAINTIKARYKYIPWARRFIGVEDAYEDNFYEEIMEDDIRLPRENLPI